MRKNLYLPYLVAGLLVFTACSTTKDTPKDLSTVAFGKINYELDYPQSWTYTKTETKSQDFYSEHIDFNDSTNSTDTMTICCEPPFAEIINLNPIETASRSFEKSGQTIKATYEIYKNETDTIAGRIWIDIMREKPTQVEQDFYDYSCFIDFTQQGIEQGTIQEIFSTIR